MTTKEFIEMLRKADPDGTAHIRMSGGVPYYAELKAGYWDGPYSYIDKDGKWIKTSQGVKVDIYCKEPSDYVWDNEMEWNPYTEPEEEAWERLKQLFVFDFNNYCVPEQRQERIDAFLKDLKEDFDSYVEYQRKSTKEYLEEVLNKYKKGYRYFQKKDYKWKFYDWKILSPTGSDEGANWKTTGPIVLSGVFEQIDRGDYIEWIPNGEEPKQNISFPNKSKENKMPERKSFWSKLITIFKNKNNGNKNN